MATRGYFDVIIHGCNCFCTMGRGIAKQIKLAFPEAFAADQATEFGDRNKLGAISVATVTRGPHRFSIVNAYTQHDFRGGGVLVDYVAVRSAMHLIAVKFAGKRLGYPRIGSGLAGGDWQIISAIIDEELQTQDHTMVKFSHVTRGIFTL